MAKQQKAISIIDDHHQMWDAYQNQEWHKVLEHQELQVRALLEPRNPSISELFDPKTARIIPNRWLFEPSKAPNAGESAGARAARGRELPELFPDALPGHGLRAYEPQGPPKTLRKRGFGLVLAWISIVFL